MIAGIAPWAAVAQPAADRINRDPVVASIEGHQIRLSDVTRATASLPENLRSLPFDTLFPTLVERVIDHQALVRQAVRAGLDEDPIVKQEIVAATERVLEGAYLAREAVAKVTEEAIKARYTQQFANRSATEEVRARHVLVTTQQEAQDILAQLAKGADFATLARTLSKDPDRQHGGDVGFFRREQVWPGFADIAFALAPGQVAPAPVHNEFGWHVIKVEERRLVAPPSFSEAREALRDELTAEAVRQAVAAARAQLSIRRFNLDGSEIGANLAR